MKGYELVSFCEFDPYAVKSYCAIHGEVESKNLGDITKVDETKLEPFNMICGGSPCQDFSIAGKLKGAKWVCKDCREEYNPLYVHYDKRDVCPKCGGNNIDKTRSSLLVEWLRIIRANKPVWGIYENVRNIVGSKFKDTTFRLFENELHEYGYNTYWKVLNAKDFGMPQNRERLYLILIKKEADNGMFTFPDPFELTKTVRDYLESSVDDKYYLSDKMKEYISKTGTKNFYYKPEIDIDVARPITATMAKMHRASTDNYFSKDFIDKGERKDITDERVIKSVRVRKLTPRESWRFMGFSDSDFDKAEAVCSNTQLIKQAGNSIVVDVLYYIYLQLYSVMPYLFNDLKVGSYFSGIGAFEKALDKLYDTVERE